MSKLTGMETTTRKRRLIWDQHKVSKMHDDAQVAVVADDPFPSLLGNAIEIVSYIDVACGK